MKQALLAPSLVPVAQSPPPWPRINILSVTIDALTVSQLHQEILRRIRTGRQALVLNVNVNALNLAYQHAWFRDYLNQADIVFCDGAGVMLGARLLGYRIPQRITYADWMWQLAAFGEKHDLRFYFLGAQPGVARAAATAICRRYPRLRVVGVQHGYFDKSPDGPENKAIVADIVAKRPHVLVLGLGMPLQEQWLQQNWDRVGANIALTGGAVFDYVSGELRRAPAWMTEHGLEWLGRLAIEPRRLWHRYMIGNPLFLWRVLKQRWGWLRPE